MKRTVLISLSAVALIALSYVTTHPSAEPVDPNFLPTNYDRPEGAIPGSAEALQQWSYQRAYPNEDLPTAGWMTAFEQREEQRASARQGQRNNTTDPWEALGPWNTAGRTLAIEINRENTTTIYAGSASGGLWRTRTGGEGAAAWERVTTGFPVLGVSSVKIAPSDTSIMYIGTGEVYNPGGAGLDPFLRPFRGSYGIGILKSTDGGQTWAKALDWTYDQERGVNDIAIHPTNPDIVYAATSEGVYKTTDGGTNWTQVHGIRMAMSLAMNPDDTDTLYAAHGNFFSTGHGIYRSYDGGSTWTQCTSGLPSTFGGKIHLDLYERSPGIIYASIGQTYQTSGTASWLCKSEDHGQTWTIVSTDDYTLWQGWFSHDVAVHPRDSMSLYAVGVECRFSTDGGTNLYSAASNGLALGTPPIGGPDGPANYIHSDIHEVEYHPDHPDTVYFGTDGGVFRRIGFTMESINGGMQTTQFYNGTSVGTVDTMMFMGGLQDNSTVLWTGTPAWQRLLGGDGSYSGLPFDGVPYRLVSYQFLNITRVDPAGNWVGIITPPQNGQVSFIAPFRVAPTNHDVLYAGRERIFLSYDGGQTWTPTGNTSFDGNFITDIAISPQDETVVVCATGPVNGPHHLFFTDDGAGSWSTADMTNLPDRYPTDLAFDPTNNQVAYVTYSGFGTGHVFKTDDFGQTWTDISGTLPDLPTSAIAVDPDDPQVIYVGNDLGIYVSEDYGATWNPFDLGLPEAIIAMDLIVSEPNRKLRLATHGNGAYQRDMLVPSNIGLEEDIAPQAQAFPNPFTDRLTVEVPNGTMIQVYDLQGRIVFEGQNPVLDTSEWPSGTYIVVAGTERVTVVKANN